ncbi:MAG TPA: hypothetical protein EYO59_12335 [Chromatiaceae bacterium]|nr:hypothetical protein [Chromatiaceae bacterium]
MKKGLRGTKFTTQPHESGDDLENADKHSRSRMGSIHGDNMGLGQIAMGAAKIAAVGGLGVFGSFVKWAGLTATPFVLGKGWDFSKPIGTLRPS